MATLLSKVTLACKESLAAPIVHFFCIVGFRPKEFSQLLNVPLSPPLEWRAIFEHRRSVHIKLTNISAGCASFYGAFQGADIG